MRLGLFKLRNRFIKAYDEGWLPPCDGHEIHYYQVGNPSGEVVIHFHGGPGGSAKPSRASTYNLKKQRIIMFDQRACGQSRYQEAFYKNTPQDTVKDCQSSVKGFEDKGESGVGRCVFWGNIGGVVCPNISPKNQAVMCE